MRFSTFVSVPYLQSLEKEGAAANEVQRVYADFRNTHVRPRTHDTGTSPLMSISW